MKKTAHIILKSLALVTVLGFLGCEDSTPQTPKGLLQKAIYENQDVTHWDISGITDMIEI